MIEKIVFMQVEDGMVTFERENSDTIIYPIALVPISFKEGDIIKAIIHEENVIEFLEIDIEEMEYRREKIAKRKASIRERAKRSSNKS